MIFKIVLLQKISIISHSENGLKRQDQKDFNYSNSTSEIILKENETSTLDSEVKLYNKRRGLFITIKDNSRKIQLMKERKTNFKEDFINSKTYYNIAESFNLENMYIVNSFTDEFSISLKNIM